MTTTRSTRIATPTTTKTTTSPRPTDAAPADASWRADLLDGFERRTLPLSMGLLPDEDAVVATLVRRTLDADPLRDERDRVVLSLPGWNDYFFHTHVAEFFESKGFTFYALDPRRSGRSLADPARRDHVNDLSEFFEDLDIAQADLASRHGSLTLLAHSTGGLIASLWASARPGRLDALALNSPWLALWGPPGYGPALAPVVGLLARRDPLLRLPLPDPGDRYAQCVHADGHGEWDYDRALKSPGRVPVRVGWLDAILRGHRAVARGLDIDAPVFLACSTRSDLRASGYSERARASDIVLDVDNIAACAPRLGRSVTLVRIEDGFHDLALSLPDARARYFEELGRWLDAYVPRK